MSVFLALGGHRVFAEHALWASPGAFDIRRENGEFVVWLGRLHLIYTPPRWSPPPIFRRKRGGSADADPHPS